VKTLTVLLIFAFAQSATNVQPKRSPASAFHDVPEAIRTQLANKGCTVPQTWTDDQPHNIVSGEFARKGQKDWAALCSVEGKSTIVVFWGGKSSCAPLKNRWMESESFQDADGKGTMRFSLKLGVASPNAILKHRTEYGEATAAGIYPDHDGIDVAFVGNASIVEYCDKGRWHQLQGAD
jgi:hypothetical protein